MTLAGAEFAGSDPRFSKAFCHELHEFSLMFSFSC